MLALDDFIVRKKLEEGRIKKKKKSEGEGEHPYLSSYRHIKVWFTSPLSKYPGTRKVSGEQEED